MLPLQGFLALLSPPYSVHSPASREGRSTQPQIRPVGPLSETAENVPEFPSYYYVSPTRESALDSIFLFVSCAFPPKVARLADDRTECAPIPERCNVLQRSFRKREQRPCEAVAKRRRLGGKGNRTRIKVCSGNRRTTSPVYQYRRASSLHLQGANTSTQG
ncbi:uncharacterized protein EI97DRAFT_126019 [Westerdykella ornata]|uniref:Uncharacterized protein n=1 Tax=Westerdykella ornata TaxID=318751 RepID=A0A6A6JCH5_WESOR|nr:uncharacterized protein EI97DRAFT_126019 [Westerdykella ornata]KAF2274320.1 hypothetical protein EI97DRAFT_126019 [Westerdykella ornata]